MRDRGIVLDPYLDHGVLVRVCEEVGVPVEDLEPSSAAPGQVCRMPPSLCLLLRAVLTLEENFPRDTGRSVECPLRVVYCCAPY